MKVLVVDDDRRMTKTTCDILTVKGYEAVVAYTGEEAVQIAKINDLGCVLMDIKMEGIDGVEALRMIKEIAPNLPVVLMSAFATEEQVDEARLLGAYSVMTKPIDLQAILAFLALLRKEESVLVVDDDPLFRKTLADVLRARGYRVEAESNAEQVLEHMERDYKLAVILDIKLGSVDGVTVLKTIRDKYPTQPVVLVTGYREEMGGAIEKGLKIGAYTCLYKPFEIEALSGILEEISKKKLQALLGEPFTSPENRGG